MTGFKQIWAVGMIGIVHPASHIFVFLKFPLSVVELIYCRRNCQ